MELLSTYAKKGDNAVLKSFAQQALPALEDLFKHVHTLKAGSAPRRASSATSMTATTTPMRAPARNWRMFSPAPRPGVNDVEASAQRPAAGRGVPPKGAHPPSKGARPSDPALCLNWIGLLLKRSRRRARRVRHKHLRSRARNPSRPFALQQPRGRPRLF